jgi:hypothetical protein
MAFHYVKSVISANNLQHSHAARQPLPALRLRGAVRLGFFFRKNPKNSRRKLFGIRNLFKFQSLSFIFESNRRLYHVPEQPAPNGLPQKLFASLEDGGDAERRTPLLSPDEAQPAPPTSTRSNHIVQKDDHPHPMFYLQQGEESLDYLDLNIFCPRLESASRPAQGII